MVATIIDVAKKCGYSKATVSRAFASPEAVSERAKARIYAAANELNYTPNPIARAMARQKTDNITFVIHENQYPAILNPFYSSALEAIMQETMKRKVILGLPKSLTFLVTMMMIPSVWSTLIMTSLKRWT